MNWIDNIYCAIPKQDEKIDYLVIGGNGGDSHQVGNGGDGISP